MAFSLFIIEQTLSPPDLELGLRSNGTIKMINIAYAKCDLLVRTEMIVQIKVIRMSKYVL